MLSNIGIVVGSLAAIATLVFVAYQTYIQRSSSELTFNLEVMKQLDSVVLLIATTPGAHEFIWSKQVGPFVENDVNHALVQALIDPVEMALAGIKRLPAFKRNRGDWEAYARYLFDECGPLLAELQQNGVFWPHLNEYRLRVEREAARRRP